MFAFLHIIFIWIWWRKYRWRESVLFKLFYLTCFLTFREKQDKGCAKQSYKWLQTKRNNYDWNIANHKKNTFFSWRKYFYFFGVLFNRCLIENWGNHILPGSIQRKENWMKDRKVPNGRGKSSCSGYWNVQTCRRSRWRSSWAIGNKDFFLFNIIIIPESWGTIG